MNTETDWTKPLEVTKAEMAFGGNMRKLLPDYDSIPKEFRDRNDRKNKWLTLQRTWFFKGLSSTFEAYPKDGIDAQSAWNHLCAIQSSWQPQHEHKEAGVAYLASLWFEDYSFGE